MGNRKDQKPEKRGDLHLQAVDHASAHEQKGRCATGPFLANVEPKLGLRLYRTRHLVSQGAAVSANQEPFFFFFFDAMMNPPGLDRLTALEPLFENPARIAISIYGTGHFRATSFYEKRFDFKSLINVHVSINGGSER